MPEDRPRRALRQTEDQPVYAPRDGAASSPGRSPALGVRAGFGLERLMLGVGREPRRGMSRRPSWLYEGARVLDPAKDVEAVVQFIGDWENPQTRRVIPEAIFLRPEGGGLEWIVADHQALRQADGR
ncbi:hypothetical protein ACFWHQ_22225 [Streptomyces sp. NPDC060334]|uniref:hypothetical protein n=1 Tax=Streptomyces sp. NPDC060334 TaxID=3347099 RepID=UPI00364633DF